MNRSAFWMIKYMNGSVFSKARYMNGVGFEILARSPVPKLPPPPPPSPRVSATQVRQWQFCYIQTFLQMLPKYLGEEEWLGGEGCESAYFFFFQKISSKILGPQKYLEK